jgi:hypothetical protein
MGKRIGGKRNRKEGIKWRRRRWEEARGEAEKSIVTL